MEFIRNVILWTMATHYLDELAGCIDAVPPTSPQGRLVVAAPGSGSSGVIKVSERPGSTDSWDCEYEPWMVRGSCSQLENWALVEVDCTR
jgi:hypothetical protein